jgi:hypothetical protein
MGDPPKRFVLKSGARARVILVNVRRDQNLATHEEFTSLLQQSDYVTHNFYAPRVIARVRKVQKTVVGAAAEAKAAELLQALKSQPLDQIYTSFRPIEVAAYEEEILAALVAALPSLDDARAALV